MEVYARVTGAGLTLFAAVLVGILIGQWLDGLAGTTGLFTLIMLGLGTGGGVYNLLRVVGKFSNGRKNGGNTL
jgi:F0F1-type ATP synthase assembly protein I